MVGYSGRPQVNRSTKMEDAIQNRKKWSAKEELNYLY